MIGSELLRPYSAAHSLVKGIRSRGDTRRRKICTFLEYIFGQGGSVETFEYCLRNGLLGVGWRTESNRNTTNWDEYFSEASKIHENLNICKYIEKWVSEGDLIWTRDMSGQYYLARVLSGWEYWMTDEAIEKDIDIGNIFRVEFKKIPSDHVPGKVVACFRAPRTIQEIADEKAVEYSKYLWNILSGKSQYQVDTEKFSDFFMMLDAEETEDLVFMYLQYMGWVTVPDSRKADTMSFEYCAVNPLNGEKAIVQVKTGNVILDRNEYSKYTNRVYLFQSSDMYTGENADNVFCIEKSKLSEFMAKSYNWLPAVFKTKAQMVTN